MQILAFDTATDMLCVALGDSENMLDERNILAPREHMERLMPAIDEILEKNGVKPEDLDALAVGIGPGSFTGLRIGVSTARALAQGLNKRIIGIATCDSIAHGIEHEGKIACAVDAKRSEVYSVVYERRDHAVKQITDLEIVSPEDFYARLEEHASDGVVVAGDALCVYADDIRKRLGSRIRLAPRDKWYPRGRDLVRLAASRLDGADAKGESLLDVQPIYIRFSQAEEAWSAKQGAKSSIVFECMSLDDLDEILEIERSLFPSPWNQWMFKAEIENDICLSIAAKLEGKIVGYALLNFIGEEGHLMNLAVTPKIRNLGLGSALLAKLIGSARERGVKRITLEVRPSNTAARQIYRKFGFEQVGIRKKYYAETNENGLILWTEDITTKRFSDTLERIRTETARNLAIVDKTS